MILSADLHIRSDRPRNRIDNYFLTQEKKLRSIFELASLYPPLVVSGDFFDKAKPPLYLIEWMINLLSEYEIKPIIIPGQHDLPQHNLKNIKDSGLGILYASNVINLLYEEKYIEIDDYIIYGCPFGLEPNFNRISDKKHILLWHKMVSETSDGDWEGQSVYAGKSVLSDYPQFDIIVTGDNHKSFIINKGKRVLINPGSMMRMTTKQIEHEPCVFILDKKIKRFPLVIEEPDKVFDLNRTEERKQQDERLDILIDKFRMGYEISVSFRKNMESFFEVNDVNEPVKTIIRESYGTEKN